MHCNIDESHDSLSGVLQHVLTNRSLPFLCIVAAVGTSYGNFYLR